MTLLASGCPSLRPLALPLCPWHRLRQHCPSHRHGRAGRTPCISLLSPDISWFKGRQPVSARKGVTVSADGRVLLIERAQLSDAGSYRCVASNVAGHTELQYGLRVNGELPWD